MRGRSSQNYIRVELKPWWPTTRNNWVSVETCSKAILSILGAKPLSPKEKGKYLIDQREDFRRGWQTWRALKEDEISNCQ